MINFDKIPDDFVFEIVDSDNNITLLKKNEFLNMMLKEQLTVSSNGVIYDKSKPGIIPSILEIWFNERVEYKNLMKKYGKEKNEKLYNFFKSRQHVQKILLNSLYGVLGLPSFRYYDIDNAEAVTLTGQDLIKFSQKIVNGFFNKELHSVSDYVQYVDTDSCHGSSMLLSSCFGNISIKDLFDTYKNDDITDYINDISNREYVFPENSKLPYYDETEKCIKHGNIKYIEKHRVNKRMFRIKIKNNYVIVTEDHSCVILVDGKLVEKKAKDLNIHDKIISIKQ